MNKLFLTILLLSVLIFISGCTQKGEQPVQASKNPSLTQTTSPVIQTPVKTTAASVSPTTTKKTVAMKGCSGFGYFTIQDHKLTENSLLLDVKNSHKDVIVTEIDFGNTTLEISRPISAGERAVLISSTDPTTKIIGSEYNESLTINYEVVGGPTVNKDVGRCVGIVQ